MQTRTEYQVFGDLFSVVRVDEAQGEEASAFRVRRGSGSAGLREVWRQQRQALLQVALRVTDEDQLPHPAKYTLHT